jgi:glycosyltransferase involved in cell wall biosynthesis
MNRKVLIFQRRMTEYRVPMFEALRCRLAQEQISLQVVYGRPTSDEKMRADKGNMSWGIEIPSHYFNLWNAKLVWQSLPMILWENQDLIIISHENSLLRNYYFLWQKRYGGNVRLAFWGHGGNFQHIGEKGFSHWLKVWTARQVDWWFAYTELSMKKIVEAGFPRGRITCLNNAIDMTGLKIWRENIAAAERSILLKELGLSGTQLAVFLGGLALEKRLPFLFAAADELKRRLPGFELLIIGDGSQREIVKDFVASRSWCRWVGARHGRDKALYATLGQVMLNPGLVGLNILDSFAFGIPLLTTDCGIHSPEIAYLESGRNGLMVADNLREYTDAALELLTDSGLREELAKNCARDADKYTLEKMVDNFTTGIMQVLENNTVEEPGKHIAIIWQRFLPYHKARIRRLHARLNDLGYRLSAIEVASQDDSYGFADTVGKENLHHVCCFPDSSYHRFSARQIHRVVFQTLKALQPDVVFAPATAFPEGMAADAYRLTSGCKRVMMDDAWAHTDRRGWLTREMKNLIHRNVDGVFVPAPSHLSYYENLGFSTERVIFGVDVVDNEYYRSIADCARLDEASLRGSYGLPVNYFLFVGRFLPKKGLESLVTAFKQYRDRAAVSGKVAWDLVLVGDGRHQNAIRAMVKDLPGVHFAGAVFGDTLCHYYGLARVLVVPSLVDQWGLVVNEGLAAGLPVLVSRGCGAARTLVKEGDNGWTFDPDGVDALALLLRRMSDLPNDELIQMGEKSREIIADWSLDRFADGVIQALALPRHEPAGILAALATKLWKGRVSVK